MFSKLLFGVQHSPQRKICVVLAVILVVLGIVIIPVQGADQGMQGVLLGMLFILVGLLAVSVIARVFASHDEKVATSEQLGRLSGEYDDAGLKQMVEHAPHDPNERLGSVTGQLDAAEIRATVDRVRGESGSTGAS